MSSMLLGSNPFIASFCHNIFALISMLLHPVNAEDGHRSRLPCIWGIGRIPLILGFVTDQLTQSIFFFILALTALDLQVLWICRRMAFTYSLRGLLLCCVQLQTSR